MTGAPGIVIGGRFRLDALIGQGGMGRVWRGHDVVLDREIAVKEVLLPPQLADDERAGLVARTAGEARAAVRLDHPGIVTIHDVIEHDGVPWIVMEYVPGLSLDAELANQGRLPWRWAAEIGAKVADVLAHAHAAGIVHRDLKPNNVLLAGDRVVVTDFGIARILDETGRLTGTGLMAGPPHYLAPEQLDGGQVDAAADIWSLGATLYRAIEGRPPFDGPTLSAVLAAVLVRDPEPPVQAGPLAPLLTQMLSKDPGHRPDVEAVVSALGLRYSSTAQDPVAVAPGPDTVTVEPPAAPTGPLPPKRRFGSLTELTAPWPGRSRVLAIGAAAAVVLLGAGYLAGSSHVLGRAPRAAGQRTVPADKSPAAGQPAASAARPLAIAHPSASASQSHKPVPPPPIGDACLVGSWRDGSGETSTTYGGTKVPLHSAGGDVDHIFASGTDENDHGTASSPLYGTYQGLTLKVIEYGLANSTIRATPSNHQAVITEHAWSANSVATFDYNGELSSGTFGAGDIVVHETYQCASNTLKWLIGGKVVDTETRVSPTP